MSRDQDASCGLKSVVFGIQVSASCHLFPIPDRVYWSMGPTFAENSRNISRLFQAPRNVSINPCQNEEFRIEA